MRRTLTAALAGVLLTGSAALAQQASNLQVTPNSSVTTPGNTVRGFDTPQPALSLNAPPDAAAVRGLAPGQDLVGTAAPGPRRLPAAVTDSYFNSQEYQQKAETIERKGHESAAKQFAGAGEAAASNLAIGGVGLMLGGN